MLAIRASVLISAQRPDANPVMSTSLLNITSTSASSDATVDLDDPVFTSSVPNSGSSNSPSNTPGVPPAPTPDTPSVGLLRSSVDFSNVHVTNLPAVDRVTLKIQIDRLFDCLENCLDPYVLEIYRLFREAVRSQKSRCDRLEKEIAAVRELVKSFVAYANQRYNSLRLEFEDARKLAEDYRTELASVDGYRQEIANLRFSLLQTTAARHKDQEKFQFQLVAIEKKLADVITSMQVAEDRASQAVASEKVCQDRHSTTKRQLQQARRACESIRIERDQLAQALADREH